MGSEGGRVGGLGSEGVGVERVGIEEFGIRGWRSWERGCWGQKGLGLGGVRVGGGRGEGGIEDDRGWGRGVENVGIGVLGSKELRTRGLGPERVLGLGG